MKKFLKITMLCSTLVLGGACLACACSSVGTNEAVVVRAEEIPQEEIIEEETEVIEEPKEDVAEEVKQKIEEWKDTFLVPILSSVSITSIVSFVATIVLTIIKNKKLDKKLIDCETKLAEATTIIATIIRIENSVKEDKIVNEQIKQIMDDQMKALVAKVEDCKSLTSKIEKIEPILKLLVQLEVKISKSNTALVKNGVIEDIQEIEHLIKNF